MTRKRTRESLAHMLCEPCPTCQGRGQVKTARSVCYDILREILREARQFSPKEFRVVASAAVVETLLDEESVHLAGLSEFIGKPISLSAEPTMSRSSTTSCCCSWRGMVDPKRMPGPRPPLTTAVACDLVHRVGADRRHPRRGLERPGRGGDAGPAAGPHLPARAHRGAADRRRHEHRPLCAGAGAAGS
jgi:hypothetical protein